MHSSLEQASWPPGHALSAQAASELGWRSKESSADRTLRLQYYDELKRDLKLVQTLILVGQLLNHAPVLVSNLAAEFCASKRAVRVFPIPSIYAALDI